jgi:uncharacterized protein
MTLRMKQTWWMPGSSDNTDVPAMSLNLTLLPEQYAICQFPVDAPVPTWAVKPGLFSITRTADELSVLCLESHVPVDATGKIERGWRAFKFEGPFAFEMTGVLLSVARPLAETGVGIFAVSTYDTDYVLVREIQLQPAITALVRADHKVKEPAAQTVVKFGWRLPNNTRFVAHFTAALIDYEPGQDRWIATLIEPVWMTETLPPNVRERVNALRGKWVRLPNEARMGLSLPLKFETLAGKVRFFYDHDPRLAPDPEPDA